MTIKEYAMSRGVSYEAVRRQVAGLKKKELKKHIKYKGNTADLDDYAIEVLDQHRQPREVVVVASNDDTQKEIKRYQMQIEALQAEIHRQATKIESLQDKVNGLLEEKTLLIEDKTRKEMLEEELNKYKPTLFGLFKKVD